MLLEELSLLTGCKASTHKAGDPFHALAVELAVLTGFRGAFKY
jgi:hypothetical protein